MKHVATARFEAAEGRSGLFSRIWRFFAVMGPARVADAPAPAAPKGAKGKGAAAPAPKKGDPAPDHGPDDGKPRNFLGDDLSEPEEGEGEERGGKQRRTPARKPSRSRSRVEEDDEGEPEDEEIEEEEEEDEADGDRSDADEGDDADEEEEDEEEGEDDDEDEDEEDDEEEDDDGDPSLEFLRERFVSKLKKGVEAGQYHGPRKLDLGLGEVKLRDEAFGLYQKALEGKDDDDPRATAAAMFEVAMDATIQVLSRYHQHGPEQDVKRLHARISKGTIESRKAAFAKTAEGKAVQKNPRLAQRMARFYESVVQEVGEDAALSVPFEKFFRLCGGKLPRKGRRSRAEDREEREEVEERALRRSRTPTDRRPARSGRKARTTDVQRSEERYERFLERRSKPLFTLS